MRAALRASPAARACWSRSLTRTFGIGRPGVRRSRLWEQPSRCSGPTPGSGGAASRNAAAPRCASPTSATARWRHPWICPDCSYELSVGAHAPAGQAWQHSAPRPAVVKVLYFQLRVGIERGFIFRCRLRCRFGGSGARHSSRGGRPIPGARPPRLRPARPAPPRPASEEPYHRRGGAPRPPCPAAGGARGVARAAGRRMTSRRPGTRACRRRRRRGVAATSGGRRRVPRPRRAPKSCVRLRLRGRRAA